MKSIRNLLAAPLLMGAAVISAGAALSIAHAAQDATAAAPAPGNATPGGPHAHWRHGGGGERLFSKLGLTAEQQASVKAIWTAAKPQMQTLHESMRANHLKLMTTKPDDPNYANVVAEVAQSNAMLASQRTSQGAELKAQMYAVLTPMQKTQLATLEAQWAANPHSMRGGRDPAPVAPAPVPAT